MGEQKWLKYNQIMNERREEESDFEEKVKESRMHKVEDKLEDI